MPSELSLDNYGLTSYSVPRSKIPAAFILAYLGITCNQQQQQQQGYDVGNPQVDWHGLFTGFEPWMMCGGETH
jgi:hypothetical protein